MHTEVNQLSSDLTRVLKAGAWFLVSITPLWIGFCNWLTGV